MSTQVNVSVPCPSDCACMCKGCTDLSISHDLIVEDRSSYLSTREELIILENFNDCICIVMVCRYS